MRRSADPWHRSTPAASTARPRRGPVRPCAVALVALAALPTHTPAQESQVPNPRTAPAAQDDAERAAWRASRYLELDTEYPAAATRLVRLGAASVPALRIGLQDPREQVLVRMLEVAGFLGPAAAPLRPRIDELADDTRTDVRSAARWARGRLAPGRAVLVAEYSSDAITRYTLDANGRPEQAKGQQVAKQPGCWDVTRTPLGHLVVAQYSRNQVVVTGIDGKQIWRVEVAQPLDVDLLPGGRVLAASRAIGVVEIDAEGNTIWSHKDCRATDAERLPDGNTWIIDEGRKAAILVDPDGEILRQVEADGAMDVDVLPAGHLLLTSYQHKRVWEVDAAGEVVWELKDVDRPNHAERLPDGTTIVALRAAVAAYDRAGKQLWSVPAEYPGGVDIE